MNGPRDPSGRPYALVWADSFSQTLDDAGARAVVDVLEANGFAPIVAPDACCGLTWITTGQLSGAKKHLASLLGVLAPFAASGIPIVGVEPSCTAVLRDDLLDLLPEDPRSGLVSSATRTLAEVLSAVPASARRLPSLEGVEIVAQPHCHHYSVMGWDADQALLESLGAHVTRLEGCCGLAGNFGMEAGHYDLSVAVASHSLLPSLSAKPDAVYLADGFSCRTQPPSWRAAGASTWRRACGAFRLNSGFAARPTGFPGTAPVLGTVVPCCGAGLLCVPVGGGPSPMLLCGATGVPSAIGPGHCVHQRAAARPLAVHAASLRLDASARSPARPRHRPPAPWQVPPAPRGTAARTRNRVLPCS